MIVHIFAIDQEIRISKVAKRMQWRVNFARVVVCLKSSFFRLPVITV